LTKASNFEALENKEFEKLLKLIINVMVFGRGSSLNTWSLKPLLYRHSGIA